MTADHAYGYPVSSTAVFGEPIQMSEAATLPKIKAIAPAFQTALATVYLGDCLEVMAWLEAQGIFVDLIIDSPPYENARTYGIGFALTGQAWVDWMVERTVAGLRVCRGLVATVVEGQTRQFRYSATPALLMADLHRRGIHLRKPPVFHRVGIPGSGGPDWLRNDWEWIVCCTNGGKLPWSENTAMGHPPKFAPGGAMSHRLSDGARVNQWGMTAGHSKECNATNGAHDAKKPRPSHKVMTRARNGTHSQESTSYYPPTLANPGNVLNYKVGGGLMGSDLSHENEAPFPDKLAEFFIRSFCPPGGTVLDRFSGSGTTAAAAIKSGRKVIAIDVRESQVELTKRRINEAMQVPKELFA